MNVRFSSILIGTRDLENSRKFYERLLGIKFDEFRPPFASFRLGDVEFNVEEDTDYREPNWANMHIGGRKPFSFRVEDLRMFIREAIKIRATLVREIEEKPWGWREAVIADPDGNEFIVEEKIQ